MDASKLDPMANPSGKLCKASPMLTMMPVFNNLFLLIPSCLFFLCTNASQNIIQNAPSNTPQIVPVTLLISILSGIKSKQTIESISPDASDKIKLKNRLDVSLKDTPMMPPIIVPNVPKNKPTSVVFNNSFIKTPQSNFMIEVSFYSSPFNLSALSAAVNESINSSKSPFKKFSNWKILMPIL